MRKSSILNSAVLSLIILSATSFISKAEAFIDYNVHAVNTKLYHSYDGLICSDCHTIHNSEDGVAVAEGGGPFPRLLTQPTATDICLQCHSYPASNAYKAPAVFTPTGAVLTSYAMPSGDFYWSMIDPKKGHNPGKSLGVQSIMMPSDPVLRASPGGDFSTEDWDCTSCHDPHNRFGEDVTAWRQLRRKINGTVHTGNETVSFGVESYGGNQGPSAPGFEPIKSNSRGDIRGGTNNMNYVNSRADGKPLEGAKLRLGGAESDINKNVYRGGFSSFCAVCHGNFHGGNNETRNSDNGITRVGGSWLRHPTNVRMNETGSKYGITTYTAVIINSKATNPNPAGYDWKYPLAQPDSDFTVKNNAASANDPATAIGDTRIMCLTCHKAHATKYDNMTRWNTNGHAFIADGEVDFTGQVSNGDNPAYGCGKCHQKGGTKAFVKAF